MKGVFYPLLKTKCFRNLKCEIFFAVSFYPRENVQCSHYLKRHFQPFKYRLYLRENPKTIPEERLVFSTRSRISAAQRQEFGQTVRFLRKKKLFTYAP
ncbi:hypothetical protein TNIN_326121 [Trichonephila inaurata madagascariensis]|uniref:Uncharacterized protein n=1 Tax=Trichonephila inaurata madagascariensis TaxID=2747483 RepID=A0A8X6I4M3_9ARAC|nr:hypothetical protein TNIN_326121 [Trichonephila inaurata madagascariensis]